MKTIYVAKHYNNKGVNNLRVKNSRRNRVSRLKIARRETHTRMLQHHTKWPLIVFFQGKQWPNRSRYFQNQEMNLWLNFRLKNFCVKQCSDHLAERARY